MAATSIKLSDELKARIAPLAEAEGISPHAWMLRALANETERAEKRAAFLDEGRRELRKVRDGERGLPGREVLDRVKRRLDDALAAKARRKA